MDEQTLVRGRGEDLDACSSSDDQNNEQTQKIGWMDIPAFRDKALKGLAELEDVNSVLAPQGFDNLRIDIGGGGGRGRRGWAVEGRLAVLAGERGCRGRAAGGVVLGRRGVRARDGGARGRGFGRPGLVGGRERGGRAGGAVGREVDGRDGRIGRRWGEGGIWGVWRAMRAGSEGSERGITEGHGAAGRVDG